MHKENRHIWEIIFLKLTELVDIRWRELLDINGGLKYSIWSNDDNDNTDLFLFIYFSLLQQELCVHHRAQARSSLT